MTAQWRRALPAIVLGVVLAGAAAAEPIAASRGRWAGAVAESTSGASGAAGRVELRFDGTAERFTVNFAGPGGALLAGEFAAGKERNVFGPPAASGLMSYLGRGSAVNPLEGKALAWARREGELLVVYRLDLSGDAHRLDRLALAPTGERMRVDFERREHDRPPQRFTATLERGAR